MSTTPTVSQLRALIAAHRPSETTRSTRVGSIIRAMRPAIALTKDMIAGAPTLPQELEPARADIGSAAAAAAAAVGRIRVREANGDAWRYVGTAFRVGTDKRRVATAAHMIPALLKKDVAIRAGLPAATFGLRDAEVEFGPWENQLATTVGIVAVEWLHRMWDLLVLRLATDVERPHLTPATDTIAKDAGICVIGYPMVLTDSTGKPLSTPLLETVDASDLGKKCASPGLVTSVPATGTPVAAEQGAVRYDASTLPGNSGSPVIALGSNHLVGLHYSGSSVVTNSNAAVYLPLAFLQEPGLLACLSGAPLSTIVPKTWSGGIPQRSGRALGDPLGNGEEAAWLGEPGAAEADQPVEFTDLLADFASISRDRTDGRDWAYTPSVSDLPDGIDLRAKEDAVAEQRDPYSCTGFALAAALNRQLARRRPRDAVRVSPAMIYAMAVADDEFADDAIAGTSLRGAIKGIVNTGACPETLAPYTGYDPGWQLTREIAREARGVEIGAYYRLKRRLFDFKAAIHTAGAVVVSAHLHPGWRSDRLDGGSIIPQPSQSEAAHAFVLVGYDEDGFLLQNSWGPGWSSWRGHAGYARWRYEDWQANLIDGWVLSLAPRAPAAFDLLEQAEAGPEVPPLPPAIKALRNPRRSALIGHAVHVERDGLVDYGRIGLGTAGLRETALYLGSDEGWQEYPAIALIFHDPALGLGAGTRLAASLVAPFKRRGIYPFHIFYGIDELRSPVLRLLDEAREPRRRGSSADEDLGPLLLRRAKRLLATPWAGFRDGARDAARPDGGLWQVAASLGHEAGGRLDKVTAKPMKGEDVSRRLHLLAFGSGTVPARALAQRIEGTGFDAIGSVSLVSPVDGSKFRNARTRVWPLAGAPVSGPLPGYRGDWSDILAAVHGGTGVRDPKATVFAGLRADALYTDRTLLAAILAFMEPPLQR